MRNHFDIIAPIYEKLHSGAKETFARIESMVSFESTDKVLDLGGGTGRIGRFLVDKVNSVVVVDSSKKMIDQCRQKYPKLSCICSDVKNLPISSDSINKIIVVDAFHHFQDQEQTIKEIKRVLVKNGEIIIEEFNPTSMIGKLVVLMEKIFCMSSVFHSPELLCNLFLSNGFSAKVFTKKRGSYYLVAKKIL